MSERAIYVGPSENIIGIGCLLLSRSNFGHLVTAGSERDWVDTS